MSIFLSAEDVTELTGIKKGRDGKTREELQCEHLRKHGVPFIPNAAGRPIVAKAAIEGGNLPQTKSTPWRSAVLTH
jgi:hypothetical protein